MLVALIIITTLILVGLSFGIFFLHKKLQQQSLQIEELKKDAQDVNKNITKLANFIKEITTQQTDNLNKKIDTLNNIEELK